jgi:hypothetical protein
LVAYAPFGHWKTTTFLAALRHDRITAPYDFDGPINGRKGFRQCLSLNFCFRPRLFSNRVSFVNDFSCRRPGSRFSPRFGIIRRNEQGIFRHYPELDG